MDSHRVINIFVTGKVAQDFSFSSREIKTLRDLPGFYKFLASNERVERHRQRERQRETEKVRQRERITAQRRKNTEVKARKSGSILSLNTQ